MPEDVTTEDEQAEEAHLPAHDDIMRRLLEYQRQLREGFSAEQAAEQAAPAMVDYAALERPTATATEEDSVVDVAAAEAQSAAVADDVWPDIVVVPEAGETEETAALKARVAALEEAIARLSGFLAELRRQSQDAAIAVDDAFAAIDELLAKAKQK